MQIRNKNSKKSNWKTYIILVVLGCILYSCSESDNWFFKEGGTLIWVDERHDDKAIKSAVHHALEHSSIVIAQISWSPEDSSFFRNIAWYYSLAKDHGKSFMIAIDWQKVNRSGTKGSWSFKDYETAKLFKSDIIRLVDTYKPNYINLGVEANYYALTSTEGFRAFASIFRDVKSEIKRLYPKLRVGLSYQLELLYGHHKGWNETQTLITLDNLLGEIDFLGVSTYPNMVIDKNQSDFLFSTQYLDTLSRAYSIPIGISETAVSSKLFNEDQREAYVRTIFKKANELNFKFVIWGSIIDADQDNSWVDKIGLLDKGGIPKKEFDIWKKENENFVKYR